MRQMRIEPYVQEEEAKAAHPNQGFGNQSNQVSTSYDPSASRTRSY